MGLTTRGSRPDDSIIELMDVVEEDSSRGARGGRNPRAAGDAEALILEDVVEEPVADDTLELTDALDEDGRMDGEGILELTEALDDGEDLADEPRSLASAEDILAAGREHGDEEIDLAELDDLLKDIEAEEDQVASQTLNALSGKGSQEEIDLADIDSLLRELEEDGGNAEADLIPAGLEADSESGVEPGAATVEYILSGLDDQMDVPPPTELPTMKIAVQPEDLSDEELDRMGGLREDGELGQLLADDAEPAAPADEEVLELSEAVEPGADAVESVADESFTAEADGPAIDLPAAVPDFTRSPMPEIPVGLADWDESEVNLEAATVFAAGYSPKDMQREPDEAAQAAQAPRPMEPAEPRESAPQVPDQRLSWRIEALETLLKDELANLRTLGDRMADVETFVLGTPRPEEWTELMEAVSALRSAPSAPPAPSVDPQEISDLRGRLDALESAHAAAAPAPSVDPREFAALREQVSVLEASMRETPSEPEGANNLVDRLKELEERAGQVSLADVEALREAIWKLEQRLGAQPAPDLGGIESRLDILEARLAGLGEEPLASLSRRVEGLESGLLRTPTLTDLAALDERTKTLERRPAPDAAELDNLRQRIAGLQDGLASATATSTGLAALEERVAALASRTAANTAADAQELTNRLDELSVFLKDQNSNLAAQGERIATLETAGKAAQDIVERMQALTGLEGRLASLESKLAGQPAMPPMAELVTDIADRVEDKVFDRLEIVLSGRTIDYIDRLENSLPEQIEAILAKRPAPAPQAPQAPVDEAALAARLERQMAARVEQLLSARMQTMALELEAALAGRLEAPLAERVESALAERFGSDLREKLDEFLEETVMGSLHTELLSELRREMPLAAAKIIREEIEALKKNK